MHNRATTFISAPFIRTPDTRLVEVYAALDVFKLSLVRDIEPMIEAYFLQHTCEELLDRLIPAGMACSAAYRISEAMTSAHATARGSVLEIDYPGLGPIKSAANPIRLSEAPVETRRKSPMVGEHTVEIMREVGYSDAEIANLKNAKAIATP